MDGSIFKKLNSSSLGLSAAEVDKRIKEYGLNEISEKEHFKIIQIILRQFRNLLVYILLAAAIISLITRHRADAIIIFLVILINATIGIIQEIRAEKSISVLK